MGEYNEKYSSNISMFHSINTLSKVRVFDHGWNNQYIVSKRSTE